jgi:NAD-dependent SIR2 family protein deacetylase
VQHADFVRSPAVRRRYWARSLVGWPRVEAARPNAAHDALARLEDRGRVGLIVTQNVDGLHQRAGSRRVLELHGSLDAVECLDCRARLSRKELQVLLAAWNPVFARFASAEVTPDGDARLEDVDFNAFRVPACPECGGILKPGVVFFGENVPRARVDAALAALDASAALLVVGSSLMVYSGYRFCLAARAQSKPIAAVNLGRTRADDVLSLKVEQDCGAVLSQLVDALDALGTERATPHDRWSPFDPLQQET